jgi:catechol 2,3-dioxygenase-like lactoylglutathione lyase family enzyme
MPIRVLEIHHPALRIDGSETNLQENLAFYEDMLGLSPDSRPASRATGSMLEKLARSI